MSDSLWPHESQHARPPCPSPTPRVHSDSSPTSRWCHPDISSSVVPFSSCSQSLPASESFPMSQLFSWGGQSTGVSALVSEIYNFLERCALMPTGALCPWTSRMRVNKTFSNWSPEQNQHSSVKFQLETRTSSWPGPCTGLIAVTTLAIPSAGTWGNAHQPNVKITTYSVLGSVRRFFPFLEIYSGNLSK